MSLILALSPNLTAELPATIADDIQWMPPGNHTINATRGGVPEEVVVHSNATAATRLEAQLQERRQLAAAGQEDIPYLDFNHDDQEASARVLAFYWGGDDPVKGGIRAKVEWTGAGKRALMEKAYRRFSPSFLLGAAGEVIGAPLNAGGLVNRAAFKSIAALPLAAKEATPAVLDYIPQSDHPYWQAVRQLVENLGMTPAQAQNEIARSQPGLFARWKSDVFVKQDQALQKVLNGKELTPELGELLAATQRANDAASFAASYQAKVSGGLSRSAALDAVMTDDPSGYRAWTACGCQQKL